MTRAVPFSKAAIKRAVEAVKAVGESVSGVEIRPDGAIRVLIGEPGSHGVADRKGGTGWEDFLDDAA